ncbi:MAG: hypothetical protein ACQEXV_06340 [Bacillota bacterium]|uniref:hypothetical protein n=1 Tax=Paenibacillus maysiensis TaxID=1155954 RepID=UPI000470A109|nr:hypothetical protein [Paenibacillus maysiensis]
MTKKWVSLFSVICTVFLLFGSSSIYAESYYAGVNKYGSQYLGMTATITTPGKLPTLGTSGESAWVTNVTPNRDWIQTGIRYYSGYPGFTTYVEHTVNGAYGMQEIGTHLLSSSVKYMVQYGSDSKWHAYIGGYDKGSWSLGTNNNVQAQAETHSTNTQMGPFQFTGVQYKNTSGVWKANDTAPSADSPYHVSKTDNANYKVY